MDWTKDGQARAEPMQLPLWICTRDGQESIFLGVQEVFIHPFDPCASGCSRRPVGSQTDPNGTGA